MTISTLKVQRLFKYASDDAIALANRHVRYQRLDAREVIAHQGQSDSPLVLVVSGQLQASTVSEDGHETSLNSMKAGESCGESAIVLDSPSAASVRASTRAIVGVISRAHARTLFSDPGVATSLIEILSRKFLHAIEGQATLSMPRAYSRIYAIINEVVARTPDDAYPLIQLPNQAAIATAANVSRETVSRAITALMRRGAIVKAGRLYQVCNRSIFADAVCS
jgi:CRP/FNR family transcriptional regulator, cyclic AMP receptor protein